MPDENDKRDSGDNEKSFRGQYKLLAWVMHGDERLPPGSVVHLSHDEAEKMLAEGTAKPDDGDKATPEEHLDGTYTTVGWLVDGEDMKIPPGSVVHLSHVDAKRMMAAGSVTPAEGLFAEVFAQAEVQGLDTPPPWVKPGEPIEPQPITHAPDAIIPELDKDAPADAPSVMVTSATDAPASTDTERRTGSPRKRSGG